MTKKAKVLFLFLVALFCTAATQGQTITGKITDDSTRTPISGATVTVKGGRTAVTTDANGVFTLPVPQGKFTLVFSSIGYASKEVAVQPGSGPLSITLTTDSRVLGDVVVTALGITRQSKTLVYAAQTVAPGQLNGV